MRFILKEDVLEYLPADWDEKVQAAEAYVEKKVSEARVKAAADGKSSSEIAAICLSVRHKAINAKARIWRSAEEALRKAGYEKCWYCEVRQDRSDKPVDHFRPKNSVIEDPGHPGYYWLAFDWKNFRYSCTFCNSKRCDIQGGTKGGKQDHFPILPPPSHARCATDPPERPKLLDPTVHKDTKLLTFLANGFPHAAHNTAEAIERVEESIKLYHLRHAPLVRKRKMLAATIEGHVSQADAAEVSGNDSAYEYHKTQIIKAVRAQAELSTAARIYLSQYRSRLWVDEILSRDL